MSEWGDDTYDDDDEGGDEPRSRRGIIIVGVAVLVLLLAGVIGYRVMNKDSTTSSSSPGLAAGADSTSTADSAGPVVAAQTTSSVAATTVAATTPASSTTSVAATSTTLAATTTAATAPPTAPTTVVATTSVVAASPPSPSDPPPATVVGGGAPSYNTLPDGTPAPIIAIFDAETITLTGAVPNQPGKDRLQALAIANSKTPAAVQNFLTIDPTVPDSIGVRVVELTSARFDTGSAKVAGAHATELDRITAIMNALPKITVLIIGHADQIGTTTANYQLSAQRATAVVNYLVQSGINPSRLSSRAVGDTDLLTLNSDAASLALNRRTEFIMYGLLGPA